MIPSLKGRFDTIFIDADDTLWENEQYFRNAEQKFTELLADYTSPEGVQQMLWQKQEDNMWVPWWSFRLLLQRGK